MEDDLDPPKKSPNAPAQTHPGPPTLLTLPTEILLLIATHFRPTAGPHPEHRLLELSRTRHLLQRRRSALLRRAEKLGTHPVAVGPAAGRRDKYGVEGRGRGRERCARAVSAEDSGCGQGWLRLE